MKKHLTILLEIYAALYLQYFQSSKMILYENSCNPCKHWASNRVSKIKHILLEKTKTLGLQKIFE